MNRETVWSIAIIVILSFAYACQPTKPTQEQARSDVENITFQRHSNGQCFAVLRFETYSGWWGSSISAVSSDQCK